MKKNGFTLAGLLAVICVIMMIVASSASAQTPVEKTFTIGLTATTASTNYTTGIHNTAYSSFKPLVVDMTLYTSNATVSLKRATTGNTYWSYTFSGTSTSSVQFVTNSFYWMRGDTIAVSIGATNIGGVIKVQGLEQ